MKSKIPVVRVKLGMAAPSVNIRRSDVAEGTTGRAVFLSDDWLAISTCFVDEKDVKGNFYVNQDQALRYGLSPRLNYYALVARLNTDAKGNVQDDTFRIEYVRISETAYTEFCEAAEETEGMQTILLKKQAKGEFSFVQIKPSNKKIDKELLKSIKAKIAKMDLDKLFELVMVDIAQPFENYLKKSGIELENGEDEDDDEPKQLTHRKPKSISAAKSLDENEDEEEDDFGDEEEEVEEKPKKASKAKKSKKQEVDKEEEVEDTTYEEVKDDEPEDEDEFGDDVEDDFGDEEEEVDEKPKKAKSRAKKEKAPSDADVADPFKDL